VSGKAIGWIRHAPAMKSQVVGKTG
jgi:hypothetical protein